MEINETNAKVEELIKNFLKITVHIATNPLHNTSLLQHLFPYLCHFRRQFWKFSFMGIS